MRDKNKIKKILIAAFTVALLFIPTYFAIGSYITAKDAPVEKKSITSLDFCDLNGVVTKYDRSDDTGKKLIDILMEVHDSARSVTSLPEELTDSEYISVTYYSYDLTSEYKYYFSSAKPSNSYYLDLDGNAFIINASAAISFLDSDFSSSLYKGSSVPVLTLNGKTVAPDKCDWSYYSYSNVRHDVSPKTADINGKVECSYRSFDPKFSRVPDKSAIKVTDKTGNMIFSGSLDTFLEKDYFRKNIKDDLTVNIEISAEWEPLSGGGSGGKIEYSFVIDFVFDPLAAFWLGESTIESGEFVVLSGKYIEIDDLSQIKVTVSPEIKFNPIFYRDGDCIRTLIPFTLFDPEKEATYKITVNYLNKTTELDLDVKPSTAKVKERKYNYQGVIDMTTRSKANFDAFRQLIAGLPCEDKVYFSGSFLTPDEKQNRARFGDTVNNGTEEEKHISNGIAWVCYKNQPVYASNSGKVIYVGNTVMGGLTVVIDHGLGLRSVYYCLDTSTVKVGDIVEKGAQIATGGGKQGYTDDHTCYFELWLGDTPVSYYPLAEGGRNGEIVIGDLS